MKLWGRSLIVNLQGRHSSSKKLEVEMTEKYSKWSQDWVPRIIKTEGLFFLIFVFFFFQNLFSTFTGFQSKTSAAQKLPQTFRQIPRRPEWSWTTRLAARRANRSRVGGTWGAYWRRSGSRSQQGAAHAESRAHAIGSEISRVQIRFLYAAWFYFDGFGSAGMRRWA